MHFSVPDTVEVQCEAEKTYTAYKVFINGVYHGSCRYSEFLKLYNQLKENFPSEKLPNFPPKKVFALNNAQISERRKQLEMFLQAVSSDIDMCNHPVVNSFLSEVHKNYLKMEYKEVNLDIYQMDGQKHSITVGNTDKTGKVFEKFASAINLSSESVHYFGLYLLKKEDGEEFIIIRQCQEFESPWISLQELPKSKLVVRKAVWDCQLEMEIMSDRVAVDLLYVQALSDLDQGWVLLQDDTLVKQLTNLRQKGSKKELLQLCRSCPLYNFLHIKSCLSDWPYAETKVDVAIGSAKVVLFYDNRKGVKKEASFNISHIKSWRIQTVFETAENPSRSSIDRDDLMHQLSFEYLMDNRTLRWIKIQSNKSYKVIFISMCIQSIVEELIGKKKDGTKFRKSRNETNHDILSGKPSFSGLQMSVSIENDMQDSRFASAIGDDDL